MGAVVRCGDVPAGEAGKRIYARFYLGMTAVEIAHAEGVHPSRVRESIRRGLKKLAEQLNLSN